MVLLDGNGKILWTTNTTVRSAEQIVKEIAGPGEELVVVRGRAELRDESGKVLWSTSMSASPRESAAVPGPSQADLAVCFDSLTTGRGYTAVVVRDVAPAEALRRCGLDDASTFECRPPRSCSVPAVRPLVIEDDLVFVRTDFSDDEAWAVILDAGHTGDFTEEPVRPTDDPGWEGTDFGEVLASLPDDCAAEVVYLADAVSMAREDHAVRAANTEIPQSSEDYEPEEGVTRMMRIEPVAVTTMHANLQIASLSWEEYCEQLDDPENDVLPAW